MNPITVTEAARQKLLALCDEHQQSTIKLSVRPRGCSGYSYDMSFGGAGKFDDTVPLDAHRQLVVDGRAVLFLLGTEMHWIEDPLQARFEFKNPQEVARCGCGESVHLQPKTP